MQLAVLECYNFDAARCCTMAMAFVKPPRSASACPSPHLFVANCGPALALPLSTIRHFFATFGPLQLVQQADHSGSRVIVSFRDVAHAQAARTALDGLPCSALGNRVLHIHYSHVRLSPQVKEPSPVYLTASETGIPGLFLYENFISEEEEQELLSALDEGTWQILSKRRVQHYGYEFQYKTRNVDRMQRLGDLPGFATPVIKKISMLPQLVESKEISLPLDQLTVNEYPAGVGLSPHIDTHSAFEGAIISLSLAGPCVMEFQRHEAKLASSIHKGHEQRMSKGENGNSGSESSGSAVVHEKVEISLDGTKHKCPIQRRSILLSERSLLVLMDEARYRWHHYIPHHKVDFICGKEVRRNQRRVSFTFRKVRHGPCNCTFRGFCDSRVLDTHPDRKDDTMDQVRS